MKARTQSPGKTKKHLKSVPQRRNAKKQQLSQERADEDHSSRQLPRQGLAFSSKHKHGLTYFVQPAFKKQLALHFQLVGKLMRLLP